MNQDTVIAIAWIIFGLVILGVGIWIAFSLYIKAETKKFQAAKKRILLQIKVTKNAETGPVAAEQMLATLHGIYEKKRWNDKLHGDAVQDHLSFEIASIKNNIYFYVNVPEELKDFVENQFYAQYPRVEITEAPDYAKNIPEEHINRLAMINLILVKNDVLPIKTYNEFEDKAAGTMQDPLSAITATMNKIDNSDDQVWLQILARPIGDEWQKLGENWVNAVKAGKDPEKSSDSNSLKKVFKIILFPLFILGHIISAMTAKKTEGGSDSGKERRAEVSDTQQQQNVAILTKSAKLGYEVKINALYYSPYATSAGAKSKLQAVAGAFKQFNQTSLNGFEPKTPKKGIMKNPKTPTENLQEYQQRSFFAKDRRRFILNIEELATIYHQPNQLVRTPNIVWVTSKKEEAPSNLPIEGEEGVTVLGVTNFRNLRKKFGIRLKDRKRHIYILGKTGMGKTTLLGNMIYGDIHSGKGLAYIDPHGDMAEEILEYIPSWRANDLVYFNPADTDYPIGFNLFEVRNEAQKPLVVSSVVSIFKKQFGDSWGPRMEWVLLNTISALLDSPGNTLLGILRMYTDESFRDRVVSQVRDPVAKDYWQNEFPNYNPRELPTIVGPIQNKVGQFLSSPVMRNMLGQPKSDLNLRDAMDSGKIIICNLSRGLLGENNMGLLGAMLVNKFQLDAMSRADTPPKDRRDFFLYVDEFQNFATEAFGVILSEARKYALSLCVANQYIGQMKDEVKEAVFGNVGSMITFQVGAEDAEFMVKQFGEQLLPGDLADLGVGEIYIKMLIDMMPSPVFSAKTIWDPDRLKYPEQIEKLRRISRERYAVPKSVIEEKILRWADNAAEARKTAAPAHRQSGGNNPYAKKKYDNAPPHEKNKPQQITPTDPLVLERLKKLSHGAESPKSFQTVSAPTSFGAPKPENTSNK
ncbi:MAG: type IV secretion system DNA-binding domain-containing protein [Patescibacteria group bacterium]|nr:type IV secretion system DNA-binding domain-containing protein [Patescibacteria group bacterium]